MDRNADIDYLLEKIEVIRDVVNKHSKALVSLGKTAKELRYSIDSLKAQLSALTFKLENQKNQFNNTYGPDFFKDILGGKK